MTYGYEGADTGIVLHAIDISAHNPFTDLLIACDDTDVLLILLHYVGDLSVSTNFFTQHNTMSLGLIDEVLGEMFVKHSVDFTLWLVVIRLGSFMDTQS